MRKFLFVLFINVLGIHLQRQCLIIIFMLSLFLFADIKRKPYFVNKLNSLSNLSQVTLIYAIWVNLVATSLNQDEFEHFKSITILLLNSLFFIWVTIVLISGYYIKIRTILKRRRGILIIISKLII